MVSKRARFFNGLDRSWRHGLFALDATTLPTGIFGWLFVRGVSQFAASMEDNGSDDPVYKKNLQRLIERNREFEETKNEPRS